MDIESENRFIAVGPTEDLSLSFTENSFNKTLVLIIFFGLLIAIALIIFLFWYSNEQVKYKPLIITSPAPTTSLSNMSSNIGNHNTNNPNNNTLDTKLLCESNNGIWLNNTCKCKDFYYGDKCEKQQHDNKYLSIGNPSETNLEFNVLDSVTTDSKSGNENSCSKLCDKNPECNGFIYQNPNCVLLKDNVRINDTIFYDDNVESTLYMKNTSSLSYLKISNKVFLAHNIHALPKRYWLVSDANDYRQVLRDNVYKINFYPNIIKNDSYLTGIYSLSSFDLKYANSLINKGNTSTIYIHKPGQKINLPSSMKYKTLYVAYI